MKFKATYKQSHTVYSMFQNNQLIGKYFIDNTNYIFNLSIIKKFRGNNYAHKLMKHCVHNNTNSTANSANINPLILHVFNENKVAINLYKSHNFSIIESNYCKKDNDIIHTMVHKL